MFGRQSLSLEMYPGLGMRNAVQPVENATLIADENRDFNLAMGFTEDQLCPNTGQVCGYRSKIVELYGIQEDPSVDANLPDGMHNQDNSKKMQLRLAETDFMAKIVNCSTSDEKCPVGVRIQQGPIRQSFVGQLFKKVFKI